MAAARKILILISLVLFPIVNFAQVPVVQNNDEKIYRFTATVNSEGVTADFRISVQRFKNSLLIWDLFLDFKADATERAEEENFVLTYKDIREVRRANLNYFSHHLFEADQVMRQMSAALFSYKIIFKNGIELNLDQGLSVVDFEINNRTEAFSFDDVALSAEMQMYFELFPSALHSSVQVLDFGGPYYHSNALSSAGLYEGIKRAFEARAIENGITPLLTCEQLLVK